MANHHLKLRAFLIALFLAGSCTSKINPHSTNAENATTDTKIDVVAIENDANKSHDPPFFSPTAPSLPPLGGPPVIDFSPKIGLYAGGGGGKHHRVRREGETTFIIVGNGPAGVVLARKLSDNRNNRVLVLEAGDNYDNHPIVLDPDATFGTPNGIILSNPPFAFVFPLLVNGVLSPFRTTAGKGWGGSSMHNFMTAVRPTPMVFDFWATFSQDDRWRYDNLLPVIRAVETYTPNQTVANYAAWRSG